MKAPKKTQTAPQATDRRRSYQAAAALTRARMEQDAPQRAEALAHVDESDVVVVPGTYDHVEQVLGALDLPFATVTAEQLDHTPLRPEQLLVVNCPGQITRRGVDCVREFVEGGGSLFTTDWALRHVIEEAFPGVLAYNDRPTADDVVRIEACNPENPFLQGVLDEGDDPVWWLEGSSYPIRVLDPDRVEVLITSRELRDKYGEAPVAVLFHAGQGEVFHMISHYYLQRTELRTERHRASGADFAVEKGLTVPPSLLEELADCSLGEVESAYASTRLFGNVVAEKKLRNGR